jgi:hypothetical protein
MIHAHEPAILDLALISLHEAIRRVASRILQAPGDVNATQLRRVARLMRIGVDLTGAGNGLPVVEFHGVPPAEPGPGALPEILSVNLTDLLAARASDHLHAALEGDPGALHALEQEAERLLETEDIQRPV